VEFVGEAAERVRAVLASHLDPHGLATGLGGTLTIAKGPPGRRRPPSGHGVERSVDLGDAATAAGWSARWCPRPGLPMPPHRTRDWYTRAAELARAVVDILGGEPRGTAGTGSAVPGGVVCPYDRLVIRVSFEIPVPVVRAAAAVRGDGTDPRPEPGSSPGPPGPTRPDEPECPVG
jgi:hypothetical protein